MDLDIDASSPLCISVVSETGEIIHSLKAEDREVKNIRLHMQKGRYSIYFSDFAGGSIDVKVSMR